MNRSKTLCFPLISALCCAAALPASAQISFSLSSDIDYRQNRSGKMEFRGGSLDTALSDGSLAHIPFCAWFRYIAPGFYSNVCAPGTTGLVTSGTVNNINPRYPYLLVTSIFPAFAVAPNEADKAILYAAPASNLPRPQAGFRDDSYTLFYNLTSSDVREYIITRYYQNIGYSSKQESKFTGEIVPGVYYYSFPSLNDPNRPAPISAVIYPMLEGQREKNNTEQGFLYTSVNSNKWNKKGFVELSFLRPNVIKWKGVSPSNVFAGVDTVSFSIKALTNQKNPQSNVLERFSGQPISIFPPYQNGREPQVEVRTPYTSNFTTPPIFDSGTAGVAQIEVRRNFQTGGVTYDYSKRVFQIPVVVVDRYTEYQDLSFKNSNSSTDILADSDGDGFNNLNEWILESNADSAASVPIAPVPELVETFDPFFFFFFEDFFTFSDYYGFEIKKKLGTKPGVKYILQISKDDGKTWKSFKSNNDWSVNTLNYAPSGVLPRQSLIQVRSLVFDDSFEPIQPPGTENDIYRVKVILKKKKN